MSRHGCRSSTWHSPLKCSVHVCCLLSLPFIACVFARESVNALDLNCLDLHNRCILEFVLQTCTDLKNSHKSSVQLWANVCWCEILNLAAWALKSKIMYQHAKYVLSLWHRSRPRHTWLHCVEKMITIQVKEWCQDRLAPSCPRTTLDSCKRRRSPWAPAVFGLIRIYISCWHQFASMRLWWQRFIFV